MNKTIITIIIVALIVLGGYFLLQNTNQSVTPATQSSSDEEAKETKKESTLEQSNQQPSSQSSAEQMPAEGKVVIYTDAGYAPVTLQIKKGETVVFKNQSSQSMWTASAFHPTHTVYPTTGGCLGSTFDTCKGVQPNENWSFRFDISGTWKYHNHSNPGDIGTVVVE